MGLFKLLTGAGTFLDPLGLWGDDGKGKRAANAQLTDAQKLAEEARKAAEAQAADTTKNQQLYEQSLKNIAANARKLTDANNASADLGNITNVIAGGTADAVNPLKKKKGVAALSTSLGINV